MNAILHTLVITSLGALAVPMHAQVSLTGAPYLASFDSLGSGLPPGWSVWAGATAAGAGAPVAFDPSAYTWSGTQGAFHNYASTDGLGAGSSTAVQAGSGDRALGVRQTSGFGDPGLALVFQVADTKGYKDFSFAFSFLLVDEESRSTTWTADYALGNDPNSFTALGTFSRSAWGSQSEGFALPGQVNDQNDPLWIRLAALSPSTGSGSRDSFAIDDFQLAYRAATPVPEPGAWAASAGLGLLAFGAWRRFGGRN